MMTGIPIENNIWSAYLLTAFLVIVGFAFYDIFHRRVPDLALVFFYPAGCGSAADQILVRPGLRTTSALALADIRKVLNRRSAWIQYSSGCCHSDWRDRHGRR